MSTQLQEVSTGSVAGLRTLDGFLERAAATGMSERNQRAHRQALERFAEFLAPRALDEGTAAHGEAFLSWLDDLGVSPASLEAYRAILSRWHEHLAWAARAGSGGHPNGRTSPGEPGDEYSTAGVGGPPRSAGRVGRGSLEGAAALGDGLSEEAPTDESVVVILEDGDDVTPVSSRSPFAPSPDEDVDEDAHGDADEEGEQEAGRANVAEGDSRDAAGAAGEPDGHEANGDASAMDAVTMELDAFERGDGPISERDADGVSSSTSPGESGTRDPGGASAGDVDGVGVADASAAGADGDASPAEDEPFEALDRALLSPDGLGAPDVPDINPVTGFIDEMGLKPSASKPESPTARDRGTKEPAARTAPRSSTTTSFETEDSSFSEWGAADSSPPPDDVAEEPVIAPVRQLKFAPVPGARSTSPSAGAAGASGADSAASRGSEAPSLLPPELASDGRSGATSGSASAAGGRGGRDDDSPAAGAGGSGEMSAGEVGTGLAGGIPLSGSAEEDFEVLSTGEDSGAAFQRPQSGSSGAVSGGIGAPSSGVALAPVVGGGALRGASDASEEAPGRWAVSSGSAERDGLTLDALRTMAMAGQIGPKTMVRKPGGEWVRASALRPLRRALGMTDAPTTASVAVRARGRPSVLRGGAGALLGGLATGVAWWVAALAAGDEVAGVVAVGGVLGGLVTRLAARSAGRTVALLSASAPLVGLLAGRWLVWETVSAGVTLDGFVRGDELLELLVWGLDDVTGACLAAGVAAALVIGATRLGQRR